MSGVKSFVLAVSLAAVLSACESYLTPTVLVPQGASAFWKCGDGFRAWVLADPVDPNFNGAVEANGIHKAAWYRHQGLSHRWNFDLNEEGYYGAAFIIEPDGDGKYLVFNDEETLVDPIHTTTCTKY